MSANGVGDQLGFRLLGPMEMTVGGAPVPVPGAAERALLVQPLLTPGRTIPATMLVDRLWSESALPVDPLNALQIRVSKLRRSLKAHGAANGEAMQQTIRARTAGEPP